MRHHARLLLSSSLKSKELPPELQVPSADTIHIIREVFTIDDAREFKRQAFLRPEELSCREIVVFAKRYLREAQNALLKVLEEPPETTRITIVSPSLNILLPTVRSRLLLVSTESVNDELENEDELSSRHFCTISLADRLSLIEKHHKAKKNELLRNLLNSLLIYGSDIYQKSSPENYSRTVQTLSVVEPYVSMTGSSVKILLEFLALRLPIATKASQ